MTTPGQDDDAGVGEAADAGPFEGVEVPPGPEHARTQDGIFEDVPAGGEGAEEDDEEDDAEEGGNA